MRIVLLCGGLLMACTLANGQQLIKSNYHRADINEYKAKLAAGKNAANAAGQEAPKEGEKKEAEKEEAPKETSMDMYASALKSFNGVAVLPTLNIVLDNVNRDKWFQLGIKAFAAKTDADTSAQQQYQRLLLPDASNFGVNLNLLFKVGGKKEMDQKAPSKAAPAGNSPEKAVSSGDQQADNSWKSRLGFGLNLYYLGKGLLDTSAKGGTSQKTVVHQGQIRASVEYAVLPRNLSFYYAFNSCTVLTQREQYKLIMRTDKYSFAFHELGLNARIKMIKESDMYFNFGTIINSKTLQKLSGTTDQVIPYIKIGCNVSMTTF